MDRILQLEKFLIDTPNDPFLNYALAVEYVALNNDTKAQELFEWLVLNHPNYFATYYHLGKLYERLEKEDEAISIYETGLEITNSLNEKHAHGELRGAYEELTYL